MRMARLAVAGIMIAAAVLIAGCGGWMLEDGTAWKSVYIYLNVADQDGEALRNVTVWVSGEAQDGKTRGQYKQLGNSFPPNWRGWDYNWNSGRIRILTDDRWDLDVEILVSRTGYESQRTTFPLSYWDPDEMYVRQTFVMEPTIAGASVSADAPPKEAPTQPEIISAAEVAQ